MLTVSPRRSAAAFLTSFSACAIGARGVQNLGSDDWVELCLAQAVSGRRASGQSRPAFTATQRS